MDQELEAILKAYDAFKLAASGVDAKRLRFLFDSRLDDVLQRWPGISRQRLEAIVERKYKQWLSAQDKPSSIPPKA
jgi:hypothetical protein